MSLQKSNYIESTQQLPMHLSEAKGTPLVKSEDFGADMLAFEPRQSTMIHTHSGDHILFVVSGKGWLLFDGEHCGLSQGDCYYVPGNVPHAVGTQNKSMRLLSIANKHRPVDSVERSTLA
jgi:quercetin dioxygenase-like cupin family protein